MQNGYKQCAVWDEVWSPKTSKVVPMFYVLNGVAHIYPTPSTVKFQHEIHILADWEKAPKHNLTHFGVAFPFKPASFVVCIVLASFSIN